KAIDEAIKLVEENGRVHFVRGQVLQKLGRTEEASAEFARSKKLMDSALNKQRERWNEQAVPSPELKQEPN
ncbi:MAG TPA: hypothetical protein VF758_01170, partial [Candidatus Acidoferrum sp.]